MWYVEMKFLTPLSPVEKKGQRYIYQEAGL